MIANYFVIVFIMIQVFALSIKLFIYCEVLLLLHHVSLERWVLLGKAALLEESYKLESHLTELRLTEPKVNHGGVPLKYVFKL